MTKLTKPTFTTCKGHLGTNETKIKPVTNKSGSGGALFIGKAPNANPDESPMKWSPKTDNPTEEFKLEKPDKEAIYQLIYNLLSQKALSENVTYTLLKVEGSLIYYSVYYPVTGETKTFKTVYSWDDVDGVKINWSKVSTNESGLPLYPAGITIEE